jgi:hypothetical protein
MGLMDFIEQALLAIPPTDTILHFRVLPYIILSPIPVPLTTLPIPFAVSGYNKRSSGAMVIG